MSSGGGEYVKDRNKSLVFYQVLSVTQIHNYRFQSHQGLTKTKDSVMSVRQPCLQY